LEALSFRRQHPVGPYILDFYCSALKLAVELDGDQHGTDAGVEYDLRRTGFLNRMGIRVIRFSNHHVLKHLDDVLEGIRRMALTPTRSASRSVLPLSGGGEMRDEQ
jgi:very-short-patch-repair endonuclease